MSVYSRQVGMVWRAGRGDPCFKTNRQTGIAIDAYVQAGMNCLLAAGNRRLLSIVRSGLMIAMRHGI